MELLIVITLLVIVAIVILIALNPWAQINKGHDSKRKTELTQLSKVFEDFYNDKQCYPKPQEICYPSTEPGYNPSIDTKCYLCGNISGSPQINLYLSRLPCDPRHPSKKYLYQVDNTSCPKWYRIYTTLSNSTNPVITEVGCQYGCGPSPNFSYNYGVSSPNIGLETNNNLCSLATALYYNPLCNICGSGIPPIAYEQCKSGILNSGASSGKTYYTDPGSCTTTCIKD